MPGAIDDWIKKAEGDYKIARRELRRKADRNTDAVCFHAHQCVEKLMKAVLVSRGLTPEYTHNLVYLDTALRREVASWAWGLEELSWLIRAGVAFRYPGEWATDAHASRAMAICERLHEALSKLIDERRP